VRLAGKLIIALGLVVLVVVALAAANRVQRELALFEFDMRQDARFTGAALARAMTRVWKGQGQEPALALLREVGDIEGHLTIRWVRLDAHADAATKPKIGASELTPLFAGKSVNRRLHASGNAAGALYTYVPLRVSGATVGALEIGESLAEERAYIHTTLRDTALFSIALLGISIFVVSLIGVIFVGRPAGALVAKTRRIGQGDLSTPLVLKQHDEMGELAGELNAMCDQLAAANQRLQIEAEARIAALEQLRHADRLATVGALASGVAHELGTPLNVVAGRAQMIASGEASADEIPNSARTIAEQAKRMAQIIRQLLDFARKRRPERALTNLGHTAEKVVALLQQMADKRGVRLIVTQGSDDYVAQTDEGQIQQVLMNIVANAIQATDRDGSAVIDLKRCRARPPADLGREARDYFCISVKDTGCGMDSATMARVFEPFFTTKEVGEGTGLGLSVAYGIVREHDGFIQVESQLGHGSTFTVYLPVDAKEAKT
jgi:two-component system NtrC family sensor kinase